MYYFRMALLGVVTICLLIITLANRGIVDFALMPDQLAQLVGFNFNIQLPLFLVLFITFAAGLLFGMLMEWVREYRIRSEGALNARELRRYQKEVETKKPTPQNEKEEILAILEK